MLREADHGARLRDAGSQDRDAQERHVSRVRSIGRCNQAASLRSGTIRGCRTATCPACGSTEATLTPPADEVEFSVDDVNLLEEVEAASVDARGCMRRERQGQHNRVRAGDGLLEVVGRDDSARSLQSPPLPADDGDDTLPWSGSGIRCQGSCRATPSPRQDVDQPANYQQSAEDSGDKQYGLTDLSLLWILGPEVVREAPEPHEGEEGDACNDRLHSDVLPGQQLLERLLGVRIACETNATS